MTEYITEKLKKYYEIEEDFKKKIMYINPEDTEGLMTIDDERYRAQEKLLRKMTNEEINQIIANYNGIGLTVNYYKTFLKDENGEQTEEDGKDTLS